jgi:predicted nucleotidyltransferase
MLSRRQVIRLLQEQRAYLAAEYGVKRIGLFGSYAKGAPAEASDIDLIVEFDRPIGFRFVESTEYLESVLGKPVDVLTPAGLDGIRIPHVAQDIRETVVYV